MNTDTPNIMPLSNPLNRNFPYAVRHGNDLPLQMYYNPATKIISYTPCDNVTIRKHISGTSIVDSPLNIPPHLVEVFVAKMFNPSAEQMCEIIVKAVDKDLVQKIQFSFDEPLEEAERQLRIWADWRKCLENSFLAAAIKPIEDRFLFVITEGKGFMHEKLLSPKMLEVLKRKDLNDLFNRVKAAIDKKGR